MSLRIPIYRDVIGWQPHPDFLYLDGDGHPQTQYKYIIFADYTDIQPKLKGKILRDSRSSIIKGSVAEIFILSGYLCGCNVIPNLTAIKYRLEIIYKAAVRYETQKKG